MAVEEIEKLKGDRKMSLREMLPRFWKYLKPEMLWIILAFVFSILNVALDVISPKFIAGVVDELEGKARIFDVLTSVSAPRYVIILAVSSLVLTLLSQGFILLETWILNKAGQKIVYSLRMEVYQHVQNMSQDQLNEMPVGSLVTRVANYTASLSELFTHILVNAIKNILTVVFVFVTMLTINVVLTLFMTIFLVVIFIISFFFRNIVRKIFTEERKTISDLNTFLNENLSGMKIIQIFNQEIRKENEFDKKNDALRRCRNKVMIAFGIYRPLLSFLYFGAIATVFLCGLEFSLSSGAVLAFYLYISKFFNPIQALADQLNGIQKAFSSSERLFNLLDVKPAVRDLPDAIELNDVKGKIEFKNVWFAYEKDMWILKDVSFTINPKETCAFVGATGAGKTTILQLIVRNYEIQKGDIFIDGINIKNIKIDSLRKTVGQMLQDVFLFTGTIRSNITLHDDSYSDEEIMKVCKYVNADSFIDKTEKGLDEEIIERGENFSQGQRQLLSFARTVLAKPKILILDEATANIDTETEVLIQESLEKIKNIGTMLVVAHRLSTIQKADQIIVLQNGEIIEKGNHQQLLKNKGYYYKLYQVQFAEK
ncbi:MAG: ABC transporter ATP-binding protein/permease [Bacilli bacterium]|nr:ABC transporter ATP-binding protein/permease [Bacilli bacterium]